MSDDAERLYELRDEIDRDARMYEEAAGRALPDSFTDESGVITVRIDDRGVVSFDIDERWRDTIETSALADRLVEAFQALNAARVEAWATHVGDASEQPRGPSPIPPVHDSVAAKLQDAILEQPETGPAVEKVLENVLAFLDDISANLDETFAGALQQGRTEEFSPLSRHLSVELSGGGHLVAVSLSPTWADRSSGTQISRELNDALREAFEQATQTRDSRALAGTPLEKYGRFVDDQDAFVAFLTGKE